MIYANELYWLLMTFLFNQLWSYEIQISNKMNIYVCVRVHVCVWFFLSGTVSRNYVQCASLNDFQSRPIRTQGVVGPIGTQDSARRSTNQEPQTFQTLRIQSAVVLLLLNTQTLMFYLILNNSCYSNESKLFIIYQASKCTNTFNSTGYEEVILF